MEYQYIADISRALRKVYSRDNGTVFITGAEEEDLPVEMIPDIAADVDAAIVILIASELPFLADHALQTFPDTDMVPELVQIEIQLDRCFRICNAIAAMKGDCDERDKWLKRATHFVIWIHKLVDYYPDARTTVLERERYKNWKNPLRKTPTPTKGKSNQRSRPDRGFDYYVGSNFDADFVRDSIKKRLDDHTGGVKGGIEAARVFLAAIKKGEIIANTPMKVFYKEFNLSGGYKGFTDGVKRLKKAS